ncbi:MAG: CidA/LrgA family protein [Rikenellaceae bacterium]|nr:CidA/LrgA family protein [Rikenellaceae bacterium]
MKGIFQLLLFYSLGAVASRLTLNILPGSIWGMVLLFAALKFNIVNSSEIDRTASFFLDNMILFFIPPAVGIMTSYTLLGTHIWAILTACTVSTILVLASVSLLFRFLDKTASDE